MTDRPQPIGPTRRKAAALACAVAAFVVLLLLPPPEGLEPPGWRTAAVVVLMAILWMTEALPLPATALLPLALFPTLGIATLDDTAAPYANPLIFLFLGGFLIALAIERWGLHRRIALTLLSRIGAREDFQIGGVMVATAAISMWVSNTATTLMMLPVALSIVPRSEKGGVDAAHGGFASALLLGVAYGASLGGVATLVGTPPNALFAGFMLENYDVEIGFGRWMLMAVPVSFVMLGVTWALLTRGLYRLRRDALPGAREAIGAALEELGPASSGEKRTALIFGVTALLWLARPFLMRPFPGLALSDTSIAIAGAMALFFVPSRRRRGERLLDWSHAERLPWGVLLLFGGGLSLASAIADSGLAHWIGGQLTALDQWPTIWLIVAIVLLITLFSELASNTATAATFLPVVAALAETVGAQPLRLAVPAALTASFAFMLPVATPPNAIVFGSGHISVAQMLRAGIWLDVIGVVVVVGITWTFATAVFGP
ncbi:MAG TPA: DASS family sodium-coupled anion symporter [Woeseiaceae bacterium]|nr:DASS family sodium-coupled anion symporter [Woeseiaceae bacterium]